MNLVVPLLAALSVAAPARTFNDPIGDATGAPDISAVAVASGAAAITFTIRATNAADWDNAAAILEIDTDASPANGYELLYVVHSLHTELTLDRSGGAAATNATFELSGSTLTIHVPTGELGPTSRIGFRVSTPAPRGEDRTDEWLLDPNASVTSLRATFAGTPARGRTFGVKSALLLFSDGTTGAAAATCSAKLNKHALPGSCSWRIPRAVAAHSMLTVVVRAAGATVSRTFRVG